MRAIPELCKLATTLGASVFAMSLPLRPTYDEVVAYSIAALIHPNGKIVHAMSGTHYLACSTTRYNAIGLAPVVGSEQGTHQHASFVSPSMESDSKSPSFHSSCHGNIKPIWMCNHSSSLLNKCMKHLS